MRAKRDRRGNLWIEDLPALCVDTLLELPELLESADPEVRSRLRPPATGQPAVRTRGDHAVSAVGAVWILKAVAPLPQHHVLVARIRIETNQWELFGKKRASSANDARFSSLLACRIAAPVRVHGQRISGVVQELGVKAPLRGHQIDLRANRPADR